MSKRCTRESTGNCEQCTSKIVTTSGGKSYVVYECNYIFSEPKKRLHGIRVLQRLGSKGININACRGDDEGYWLSKTEAIKLANAILEAVHG